jgi:metallo-beta-lactamase superfamily protein
MPARHVLNIDLARVFTRDAGGKKKLERILAWGDPLEVVKVTAEEVTVKLTVFEKQDDGSFVPVDKQAFIEKPDPPLKAADVAVPRKDNRVLRVDFVDVQQGDGAVLETPAGTVMLVDGGDNALFARYLASRFRGTSAERPKEIGCILVTHGDADHFLGLTEIHRSETDERLPGHKRLFIHPRRVYHNGLVKRPSAGRKETELLGRTREATDPATGKPVTVITGLEEDLLAVPDAQMNKPFLAWKQALKAWRGRGAIRFRRLALGDHDAFDFLKDEGLEAEVLGPIPTKIGAVEGLRFLGNPPPGPRIGQESLQLDTDGFRGKSASHTINGHSVVLRLRYGRFRFLLAGDLNDEAERLLTSAHNRGLLSLQSEVLKVPHHGSADFSGAFLQAVSPVVSVISCGDESARKEFIHPRATLLGALGRYSRVEEPLIFVTELAAFFAIEGFIDPRFHELTADGRKAKPGEQVIKPDKRGRFFALSRSAFGIVMVRTDGDRLLVYTNSGLDTMKEAYAYRVDEFGKPVPTRVRQA